jgi:opacity protein-like surface antigen
MPSVRARSLRPSVIAMLTLGGLLASLAPVSAQGFGVGGRIAWVNPDTEVDVDSVRYFGGQIRLSGGRVGLEVSLDRHSESSEALNQKLTETPIQASLLLRMGSGKVAPFLLGGPGWYRRKVEALDGPADLEVSTTEFGWHAGIGLEILPTRHFGIHGDYRYTFLDFGDDDDDDGGGIIGGLLPGHRGSMWTLGATFYF